MSKPEPEPATAPGTCTYCDKWTAKGVVIAEIHSDSGPGHTVVRHPACIGQRKPVGSHQPRTWSG